MIEKALHNGKLQPTNKFSLPVFRFTTVSLQYINGMNYLFVLEIKVNDKTILTDSRPNRRNFQTISVINHDSERLSIADFV